jgi:hypothetical protein
VDLTPQKIQSLMRMMATCSRPVMMRAADVTGEQVADLCNRLHAAGVDLPDMPVHVATVLAPGDVVIIEGDADKLIADLMRRPWRSP